MPPIVTPISPHVAVLPLGERPTNDLLLPEWHAVGVWEPINAFCDDDDGVLVAWRSPDLFVEVPDSGRSPELVG